MTTPITNHEGKKYLRRIFSAVKNAQGGYDSIEVDFYAIANACEVKDPAIAHALKKLLFPGRRNKGSFKEDLIGALACINRAIEQEEILEQQYPLKEVSVQGKWEVIDCFETDREMEEANRTTHKCIGSRVRWSIPDADGRYLWVRHYMTDGDMGAPSITWCQNAAQNDAKRMNEEKKSPSEYSEGLRFCLGN